MGRFNPKRIRRRIGRQFAKYADPGDFWSAQPEEVQDFVDMLRDAIESVELMRIGGNMDGGYLVPNDFADVRYCFSPGVARTADFEDELAQHYGIKSFLADASVEEPPIPSDYFEFRKKFLGARDSGDFITLSRWMADQAPPDDNDMILQMDIEGAEFEVLVETSIEQLRRFRVMVIEFHRMERMFAKEFLPILRAIFAKLCSEFSIVHMHPNNCCGTKKYAGVEVPVVLEITFLRKDRLDKCRDSSPIHLPHPLDQPNVGHNPNLVMPEMWWRDAR